MPSRAKKRKRSATRKIHNNCIENARPNGFAVQLQVEYQGRSGMVENARHENLLSPKIPNIVLATRFHLVKRILYTVSSLPELKEEKSEVMIFS